MIARNDRRVLRGADQSLGGGWDGLTTLGARGRIAGNWRAPLNLFERGEGMRIRGLLTGVAVGALLVGAAQSGYAQTGNTGKALVGTWVLDTSKSDFGKTPAPKSG